MDDNTLMIMATIESVNHTLNEIRSILESMRGELHDVDYLRVTDYEEDKEEL